MPGLGEIWPAVLLTYSFLLPPEIHTYIGPLRFGAPRLFIVLLLPIALSRWMRSGIRFTAIDALMILFAMWQPLAFAMNTDLSAGIESGGSTALDTIGAYFIGRTSIRGVPHFVAYLRFILPALMLAAASLFLESVSRRFIVRPALQAIFGNSGEVGSELIYELRSGLLRAYGPFSHPIHGGLLLTAYLPLYFAAFRNSKERWVGMASSFGAILSLSSSAAMGIVINTLLVAYDRVQKRSASLNWSMFLYGLLAMMFVIQFFSKNGLLPVIFNYLTFNPGTGSYRMMIWTYATDDVWDHFLFGIGYANYTRPDWMWGGYSVDAHFLLMGLRFGGVAAFTLLGASILLIVRLGRMAGHQPSERGRDIYVASAISLSVVTLILFTVALFGATWPWHAQMLGIGASLVSVPAMRNAGDMRRSARAIPPPGRRLQARRLPPGGAMPSRG